MQRSSPLIALMLLVGCGGGASTGDVPTTTIDHAAVLADHESADLAARLVPVAGYAFVDPPAAEVAASLARLHDLEIANGGDEFFADVSYHSVVADDASQNKAHTASGGAEVGYLAMMAFTVDPPSEAVEDPQLLAGLFASAEYVLSTEHIAGVPVLLADNPESDDSRFTYVWLDEGVISMFDGATTPTMERWLEQYLAG
jgi:hypothetical protein